MKVGYTLRNSKHWPSFCCLAGSFGAKSLYHETVESTVSALHCLGHC